HPGWTATELQRHTGIVEHLNDFFAQDISMGALPTLRAAYDNEAHGGEYYGPSGFMELRGYPMEVSSNLPCYVETFHETFLPFYEECGFQIAGAGQVPRGGPNFWATIRAPRG